MRGLRIATNGLPKKVSELSSSGGEYESLLLYGRWWEVHRWVNICDKSVRILKSFSSRYWKENGEKFSHTHTHTLIKIFINFPPKKNFSNQNLRQNAFYFVKKLCIKIFSKINLWCHENWKHKKVHPWNRIKFFLKLLFRCVKLFRQIT